MSKLERLFGDSLAPRTLQGELQSLKNLHEVRASSVKEKVVLARGALIRPTQFKETDPDLLQTAQTQFDVFSPLSEDLLGLFEKARNILAELDKLYATIQNQEPLFQEVFDSILHHTTASMRLVGPSPTLQAKVIPMMTSNHVVPLTLPIKSALKMKIVNQNYKKTLKNGFYLENAQEALFSSALCPPWRNLKFRDVYDDTDALSVDPRIRSDLFSLGKNQPLANYLWTNLSPYFGRKEIVKTIGGHWKPKRINECFKFIKCLSGVPHLNLIPGPWEPRPGEVSPNF